MGSNPFISQQKCFSCSSVAVRGAETSNLLVVGAPRSFLLPFVTFYLLYCYSCTPPTPPPSSTTHPPTQPLNPTSFFIFRSHIYWGSVDGVLMKSWGAVICHQQPPVWRPSSEDGHITYTLIIMTPGAMQGGVCVCACVHAFLGEFECVCVRALRAFCLTDADGIMSPQARDVISVPAGMNLMADGLFFNLLVALLGFCCRTSSCDWEQSKSIYKKKSRGWIIKWE